MKILAVKLYEKGFVREPFFMGGEGRENECRPDALYRQSLQNYLIDTGSEIILVDTGMPAEMPDAVPDEKTQIHIGARIRDYVSALRELGYEPEQVSRILVTHHHVDHTGELRAFPNATIHIGPEDADTLGLQGPNVVRAAYSDGPYFNFDAHDRIAEGIAFVKARGHTKGNSIVIVEDGGLFYMMHGDVTYSDEALYAGRLSVVAEDEKAARDTLDRVRSFVAAHPTVYCSTHTPLGYENLEARRTVDLNNPPAPVPPEQIAAGKATGRYVCPVCGWCYDPAEGDPARGIAPGTPFEDLPGDWTCPRCRRPKNMFGKA